MPRYFFDVEEDGTIHDPVGEILLDNAEAQSVAVSILAELAPGRSTALWGGQALQVHILDAKHRPIGRLCVTAVNVPSTFATGTDVMDRKNRNYD